MNNQRIAQILKLRQSEMSLPNGSHYAVVAYYNGKSTGATITRQIEENGEMYEVSFTPRTKDHSVDFGAHFASGGGAYLEGGEYSSRKLTKETWIRMPNPRIPELSLWRHPLREGEEIPDGAELYEVWD